MIKEKILKSTFFDFTGNIVINIFLFIASIIIARGLGAEMLGKYAAIIGLFGILNIFVDVGTSQALVYYFGEAQAEESKSKTLFLIKKTLQIKILTLVLISFVIFIIKEPIFNLLGLIYTPSTFLFIIFYSFIQALTSPFAVFLRTHFQQKYVNSLETVLYFFNTVAVFILFVKKIIDVRTLLFLSLTIVLFRLIFYVKRFLSVRPENNQNQNMIRDEDGGGLVKRFLPYTATMFAISLSGILMSYRSDLYFISFYLGLAAVGYYNLSQSFSDKAYGLAISGSFGTMYTSAMVSQYKKYQDKKIINKYFQKFIEYVYLFSLPMAVGGSLMAHEIIYSFYGSEYMTAKWLLIGFLVIMGITRPAGAIAAVFITLEKPKYFFWTKIITIINIPLNIALIPKIGVFGALVASTITQVATIGTEYFIAKKKADISMPWEKIIKISMAAAAMGILIFFLKNIITFNEYLRLAVIVTIGASFYFFVVYYFKIADQEYIDLLKKYFVDKINSLRKTN